MIEIEKLSREWSDFQLKDISLEIEKGEFFVILGPTGSGKTLFLELIAGFYEPDKGKIIYQGEDYTDLSSNKRGFAFVYQDYMLFPHLNVKENIAYGLKVRDENDIDKKVMNAAKKVEVENLLHRDPSTLSGGEKQRVALARALVLEPQVLLLDEPFGSLDNQTAERMRKLVKDIHSEYQGSIIHVTHDQEEAVVLGDRVAVMKDGEIVQVGEPSEIMRKPRNKFVAEFVGTGNIFHGKAKRDGNTSNIDLDGISIATTSSVEGDVTVTLRPEDIIIAEESLESSARNVFRGTVKKVIDRGIFHEIRVDVGIPFIVYVTKQSVERLYLKPEKKVFLLFKASAVHVFNE